MGKSGLELYTEVFDRCFAEFPKFNVKPFSSSWWGRLMKATIWRGAAGITFWNTIIVDDDLIGTEKGAELLSHEVVHVRDQHRWLILFPLSYFLLLPVGPSLKAVWEWRAYKETLRWVHEHPNDSWNQEYRNYIDDYYCQWVASQFVSPMYFWMWPFKSAMYKKAKDFVASLP